jgi:hypothetical protein
MPEQKENIAPVRRSVVVDCPIEDAFEIFTQRLDEWWPVSSDPKDWGEIVEWDPPQRVSWCDGRQTIDVAFSVEAYGTRVTVTHSGWENAAGQASARAQWGLSLERFARAACGIALLV